MGRVSPKAHWSTASQSRCFVLFVVAVYVQSTFGLADRGINKWCVCTWPYPIFWARDPVCGVDGHTYINACSAACHGTKVACRGRCPCEVPTTPKARCRRHRPSCPTTVKPSSSEAPKVVSPSPMESTRPVPSPSSPITTESPCKACPTIYNPVCGVDGKTYGNECLAKCAKVAIRCSGECPCPAKPSITPPPKVTVAPIASVEPPPIPPVVAIKCEDCPETYNPVCGVDGKTYDNECLAKCSKVDIACPDECPCSKPGPIPASVVCPPTLPGHVTKCEDCPKTYDPVCGVDGKTYGNGCLAKCAKVAIACPGECPCSKPGFIPSSVVCPRISPIPAVKCEDCPKTYDPVCGVDGKTYDNECLAKCAKVDIACPDVCPCSKPGTSLSTHVVSPPKTPGTSAGCDCPKTYDPVCGVDGKTYENECLAKCGQVAIACSDVCPCSKPGTSLSTHVVSPPKTPGTSAGCDCPAAYDPVCGVDGKTYENECLAKCAKVDIACADVCPCSKEGVIPSTVVSPPKPATKCEDCPKTYNPVCGVDGKTYENECLAKCGQVAIACSDVCPCSKPGTSLSTHVVSPPKTPGTSARCDCPEIYDPVCGVDGKTYENECLAKCAKVDIACPDVCPCPKLGAFSSVVSPPKTPGTSTGCDCPKTYDPVCGVDGKTYENECLAKCAQVAIACSDVCPCSKPGPSPSPKVLEKPTASVVSPPISPEPSTGCDCPKIYNPVCGVDGNTYGNECLAKCAKVDIACPDACPCPKPSISPSSPEPTPSIDCKTCSEDLDPVCGEDGRTYRNECAAKCRDVVVACPGKCPCPKPSVAEPSPEPPAEPSPEPVPDCDECTFDYSPVCASDGATYVNACMAICKRLTIECNVPCPCPGGVSSADKGKTRNQVYLK